MRIIRRSEAEQGFSATDHISYPLPEGSTISYVVEGRVKREQGALHTHDQEEFWFIIDGSGKARYRTEDGAEVEVEVSAGDLAIIPAGMPHMSYTESAMRELAFMVQTGRPDAITLGIEAKRQKETT